MVLDYSKWDKLELSDDSDIEVHPNVDKKSFIRWKQRDIHEKREHNRLRTQQLELNLETNNDLLKAVDELLKIGGERKIGLDVEAAARDAASVIGKAKPGLATSPDQPKYVDMLESLVAQVAQEAGTEQAIIQKIEEHRKMITSAISDEKRELETLREERTRHLTSEDVRTGWDSSFINKSSADATSKGPDTETAGLETVSPAPKPTVAKQEQTAIETLNSPIQSAHTPEKDEEGIEKILPATKDFGETEIGDLASAYRKLSQTPWIATEGQKDALTMTAFDAMLSGDAKLARKIVWNAQLLQYAALLGARDGGGALRNLVTQLGRQNHPARAAFEQEVTDTFNHIRSRCEILAQPEEQIQLYAVDPDTEIRVDVPPEGTPERERYDSLDEKVRTAIETRELDQINSVLGSMPVPEAENLVQALGEAGVIQVEPKVYDSTEWERKKEELGAGGPPETSTD